MCKNNCMCTAEDDGICAGCGAKVKKGMQVFKCSLCGAVYCSNCMADGTVERHYTGQEKKSDVEQERKQIRVQTKVGTIVAYPSIDPNYPGIYVDFMPEGTDDMFAITAVETHDGDKDGVLYRYDWNDPETDDTSGCTKYPIQSFRDAIVSFNG